MISVLYVDDESGLLEIGKLFLEESGQFIVDTITSAQAALSRLKTKTYSAIISDYQMPGMDGIEFSEEIHNLLLNIFLSKSKIQYSLLLSSTYLL